MYPTGKLFVKRGVEISTMCEVRALTSLSWFSPCKGGSVKTRVLGMLSQFVFLGLICVSVGGAKLFADVPVSLLRPSDLAFVSVYVGGSLGSLLPISIELLCSWMVAMG